MHELSLVAELVSACEAHAAGRPVRRVRVRVAGGHGSDELRLAFAELAAGSVLAHATLEIEHAPSVLHCACGFSGAIDADDVGGHLAVCPRCAAVRALPSGLELVALALEG